MKVSAVIAAVVAVIAIGFGVYMVDIDQTEEGSMPDVDIAVEGGNMPEFDAEVGDIETGTEEVTLDVPTIEFESPEEEAAEDS